ncbi:MAG: holo-(acyl-carrier-protein) synthase [Actinomycetia bacterium]|nr:holo-(acyl-carrier-protein) synthase [Actinomycetes bacterium]
MSDTILGLGTDLVELPRFRLAMSRRVNFETKLFSPQEQEYSNRYKDPAPRFAARFAAKEAVMKALGVGLGAFPLRDVEVERARSGAPSVRLYGKAAAIAEKRGVREWRLSLTHSSETAMAVAIAIGD